MFRWKKRFLCLPLGFLELATFQASDLLLLDCFLPPDLRDILKETDIFGRLLKYHRIEMLHRNVKLEDYTQV